MGFPVVRYGRTNISSHRGCLLLFFAAYVLFYVEPYVKWATLAWGVYGFCGFCLAYIFPTVLSIPHIYAGLFFFFSLNSLCDNMVLRQSLDSRGTHSLIEL